MAINNPTAAPFNPNDYLNDCLTAEEDKHFDELAAKLAAEAPKIYPIVGARSLTPSEVDLMNLVKKQEVDIGTLVRQVQGHLMDQRRSAVLCESAGDEIDRIDHAEPGRWAAIARTHFQQGCMALSRAIAQPSI